MRLTLRQLNDAFWYRVLKVIWVGSLIVLCGAAGLAVASEKKERTILDPEKTEVLCIQLGGAFKDLQTCPFSKLDSEDKVLSRRFLKRTSVWLSVEGTQDECPDKLVQDRLQAVCQPEPLFDPDGYVLVVPVLKTVGGWREIVPWALGGWLLIYGLFEGTRPVFYYVVAGSWRPKV